MESQIQQGEQIVNKRSVNTLSEKSYIKYHQTPLLPAVQERINNPAHQIENIASVALVVVSNCLLLTTNKAANFFSNNSTFWPLPIHLD
jgi:hypothetical protein